MKNLEKSLIKLDNAVKKKLNSLSEKTSIKELREINSFIRESNNLRNAICMIDPEEEETIGYQEEGELFVRSGGGEEFDYVEILCQACELIGQYHVLVDTKKVKETKSEWVLEDAHNYIIGVREIFGNRIPALPGTLLSRGIENVQSE